MQPTQALLQRYRKLPLTTKDIKKGFYKGTRTGTVGRHTKYGGFVIDWSRVRTYVVPPLENFKVCRPEMSRVDRCPGRMDEYMRWADRLAVPIYLGQVIGKEREEMGGRERGG